MALNKKLKIILSVVFVLMAGIGFLFVYMNGVFSPLIKKAINKSPEAKISAYIEAVSRGNKEKALDIWVYFASISENEEQILLKERMGKLTDELIKAKINPDFKIIGMNCCTPDIMNDSGIASRKTAKAELIINNEKKVYIFDFYSKDFDGITAGHWEIGDIYPQGEKSLFWKTEK